MNDAERYKINESNLQSYRLLFIISGSSLLIVGSIVLDTHPWLLVLIASISLFIIWAIWYPVVKSRHLIVDYYKYCSNFIIVPEEVCDLDSYINEKAVRLETNEILGITSNWRTTRRKIDFLLPLLYSILWLAMVVYMI